jgi:hypothetical protein
LLDKGSRTSPNERKGKKEKREGKKEKELTHIT